MTTPEMIRCKKCSLCQTDEENDKWICTECNKDIHEIKDEDCPLEQDY